jgi:hypothetical protein
MSATGIFLTLLVVCALIVIFGNDSASEAKRKPGKAKPKKKAAKPGQPGKVVLQKAGWSKDPEQFEATGGATFQEIVNEAARLAAKQKHPVKFGFNRRPGEKQYRVFPGGYFELTN